MAIVEPEIKHLNAPVMSPLKAVIYDSKLR
jgi:hypothetical protein